MHCDLRKLAALLAASLLLWTGDAVAAVEPPRWTSTYASPLVPARPVARPFAAPASPYGPGHRGVDLPGAVGEPVLAAADGVVAFAGVVVDRGVVSVRHVGGLRTTYEPVEPTVTAGAVVRRGDQIGLLVAGHPGCASACLHWGLRRGDEYLNPLVALHRPRVRLLPVP
ncbi:murein DD-endopeptidase MepM/ murein hydrolase activator NlpD [Actinokineospora baliensis]|uniref:M23 family metallopeptidase n=1 Tax=Actinokineospora baliensis TaxID=547056 RepID=UPI00195C6320|nr:peptidoglycan DD-metalloendopeptidase family protein [Actinokineospora baliensis]MBM7772857.1 murein DD-endopeptidase MepM/ murein hydrolase activator NlpD [Actinokineospora baliensis]